MILIEPDKSIIETADQAIAHGCNTRGIMGVGAALAMKRFYSSGMYVDYERRCYEHRFKPGDIYRYDEPGKPILFNLAVQSKPGKHAKIQYLDACLDKLAGSVLEAQVSSLSMTPPGGVHGGLDKELVIRHIRSRFEKMDLAVTIYTHEEQFRYTFTPPILLPC
jgi:hypothetical protein